MALGRVCKLCFLRSLPASSLSHTEGATGWEVRAQRRAQQEGRGEGRRSLGGEMCAPEAGPSALGRAFTWG